MAEWLGIEKEIALKLKEQEEEIKKSKETNFKLLGRLSSYTEYIQKLEGQVESLQKDVVRKIDTNSRLREENLQIKIDIEMLFDNWALGNYPEGLFFTKLQMLIHKLQQN